MVPQPDIGATHRAGCLCKAKNSDSLSYFSPVTPAPPTLALEHCCPSRAAEGTHLPPRGREAAELCGL